MLRKIRVLSSKMVGKVYGRLTILRVFKKNSHMYALCACSCGNSKEIATTSIKRGSVNSCGCLNSELARSRLEQRHPTSDLTGKTFGKWTVVSKIGEPRKNSKYLCKCTCGSEKEVLSNNLLRGTTKGCGCGRIPVGRLKPGQSAFNNLFGSYKRSAKSRGPSFSLKKEMALELFTGYCFYCGRPPEQKHKVAEYSVFTYNGIDRVDNTKGYEEGNVVSCCKKCNSTKHTLTFEEFKTYITAVFNRIGGQP